MMSRSTGTDRPLLRAAGVVRSVIATALVTSVMAGVSLAVAAEPLSDRERAEVVDSVSSIYRARYLFPELGATMDSLLHAHLQEGRYRSAETLQDLTQKIRNDLREFSRDRHIWVEPIPEDRWYVVEGDTATTEQIRARRLENFGWKRLEWLPGAVGYIKVDMFDDPAYAGETAERALSLMANCLALIIDLREHHGGYDTMLQLVTSFFFDTPTQLNSLYWTYCDSTLEAWTHVPVNGTPLYDKTLYLLTSSMTASGAEAFAYNLKHLRRATVIGETTGGAAHWCDSYEFPTLNVAVSVPVARPINPVTGTSWEQTGVEPHIAVPAAQALHVAYLEALKNIRAQSTEASFTRKLDWNLAAAAARVNPVTLSAARAEKYAGRYQHPDNEREYAILFQDGELCYQHYSGAKYILIPLTETVFAFGHTDDQRLEIVFDGKGNVDALQIVGSDGSVYRRSRVRE